LSLNSFYDGVIACTAVSAPSCFSRRSNSIISGVITYFNEHSKTKE
jgi:hypothetical protein